MQEHPAIITAVRATLLQYVGIHLHSLVIGIPFPLSPCLLKRNYHLSVSPLILSITLEKMYCLDQNAQARPITKEIASSQEASNMPSSESCLPGLSRSRGLTKAVFFRSYSSDDDNYAKINILEVQKGLRSTLCPNQ
jgi:hypothetical protein